MKTRITDGEVSDYPELKLLTLIKSSIVMIEEKEQWCWM